MRSRVVFAGIVCAATVLVPVASFGQEDSTSLVTCSYPNTETTYPSLINAVEGTKVNVCLKYKANNWPSERQPLSYQLNVAGDKGWGIDPKTGGKQLAGIARKRAVSRTHTVMRKLWKSVSEYRTIIVKAFQLVIRVQSRSVSDLKICLPAVVMPIR